VTPELLNIIAIIIGSGGIVGGIAAAFRIGPDRTRLVVGAAQDAVVVQKSVIESLTAEIDRLHEEKGLCEEEVQELRDLLDLINERKINRRRSEQYHEDSPLGGSDGSD